jgi:hypothetical protein
MAKDRSPNYPAFSLPAALQFAKKLYGKEGRTPSPLEAVAKALDYSSVSGPVRSKVAAMKQYGLVEEAPQGKMRVSERALRLIKHDPNDPQFLRLVREAALQPTLFAEIHQDYPGASDANLEIQLEAEKGFSKDGAARVIRSYRETASFAKLDNASYDGPQEVLEPESETKSQDRTDSGSQNVRDGGERKQTKGGKVYTIPALDGTDIQIVFQKRPTPEVIESMIGVLNVMKPIWGSQTVDDEEV